VEYGKRFLVKLWNVSGFAGKLLAGYEPSELRSCELQLLDRWILSKTARLTQTVTDAMENCQFNIAVEEIRNFTWHVFCDCYVEAVKDRLYRPETHGEEGRRAAQFALHEVLFRVLQFLAPIAPHVSEDIYQALYGESKGWKSLQLSSWPVLDQFLDDEAEGLGDMVIAVISEVRREKAERHLPLNTQIKKLTIFAGDKEKAEAVKKGLMDIAGTCRAENVEVLAQDGSGRAVGEFPDLHLVAEY
jgi:valyl-tRNA synthetase